MDIVDTQTRSRMMSSIRGKDTSPEMLVRRWLHAEGFRYSLHAKGLSGKPDLVLRKWNAVIFIHGCFWHRHEHCKLASRPKTRIEFWTDKFSKNVIRDIKNQHQLIAEGWRVAIVWECGLRKRHAQQTLPALVKWLHSNKMLFENDAVS